MARPCARRIAQTIIIWLSLIQLRQVQSSPAFFFFSSSSRWNSGKSRENSASLTVLGRLPRGGGSTRYNRGHDGDDDDDDDDQDDNRQNNDRRPSSDHQSSSSSSLFSSIVRQSSKALAATARGSTQIAADLVRPKEVDWDELVGFWRLDVALMVDSDMDLGQHATPILTLELTRNGRARFTDLDGQACDCLVDFRPASWPRSARLRFGRKSSGTTSSSSSSNSSRNRKHEMTGSSHSGPLYECTIQRKLANLDIIKLRGKIYALRRFQGKIQIGTFVGRRRVVILDSTEEEESEDEQEEGEEYDDNPEELDEDDDVVVKELQRPDEEIIDVETDDSDYDTDED